jgi:hypothetical protein
MFDIISNYFHIIINLEKNISIVNIAICGGTSISKKISGNSRIGPHNSDVISIIFGSLLGDAQAERKNLLAGTRISFSQEGVHLTYILWLHNKLSTRGYCNILMPKITTRLVEGGKLRKVVRLHT